MKFSKVPTGGYGIISRRAMRMKGPSKEAKAVYALLCSYTGDSEFCFPSIETQAQDLECSPATIKRLHAELERFGLISKGKLKPDAWDRRNKYYPQVPEDESEAIKPQGLTDEPMQELTSEPVEGLTGETIEGLTDAPLIITGKTNSKKNNKDRKPGGAPPGFTRRVSDLIGEAHRYLTGENLEWEGKGAAYGKAVNAIVKIASKEPDQEKAFQKIRQKCAAYYAAAQADQFMKRQGITPVSLLAAWNKVHYTGQALNIETGRKKFPDYRAMSPKQIREAFAGWNKSFTMLDLKENLPKDVYEQFEKAGGFAPALVEILVADVQKTGVEQ